MIGGFEAIDEKYIDALNSFINEHNSNPDNKYIDSSHGILHMITVLQHTKKALISWESSNGPIDNREKLIIMLAALFHDIDDSKYFPDNNEYQNARNILTKIQDSDLTPDEINEIIKIISWVSSSKNGDMIPEKIIGKEYYLYPRYSDRLEALGIIGLERTLHYTKNKNGNLFDESTLRAKNEEDLFENIATEERYLNYNGKSKTMIDHFYDKLLRLGKYPIYNEYFNKICEERIQPLIKIVLEFGERQDITQDELEELINVYIEENK